MAQSQFSFVPGAQSPRTPTGPTFPPAQFMSPGSSGYSTPVFSTPGPGDNHGQGRKRGADSSLEDPTQNRPHDSKRRRPNLANGFQAMSIDPNTGFGMSPGWLNNQTQQTAPGAAPDADDDDDGLEPTLPPLDGDVGVEVLPDHPHTRTSPRYKRPREWKRNSSFSSTSPSEEDDDYESDATFRLPARPSPPVLPTSVEDPPETPVRPHHEDGVRVEMLESSKRKQRASTEPQAKKRRREGMDVDMDALPEGSYGPGWYEPEKDRIVVTTLSSPESSPPPPDYYRSGSPESKRNSQYSYDENRHLTQPGHQGFTISPSLLTHIINAQREQFVPGQPSPERGLVLYRPIGAANTDPNPIVQEWEWNNAAQHGQDSHRFEEVDDDEDLMTTDPAPAVPNGMDTEGSAWEQPADEAMDIE